MDKGYNRELGVSNVVYQIRKEDAEKAKIDPESGMALIKVNLFPFPGMRPGSLVRLDVPIADNVREMVGIQDPELDYIVTSEVIGRVLKMTPIGNADSGRMEVEFEIGLKKK